MSNSPSPTGVKAIYTYIDDVSTVKRWSHDPKYLTDKNAKQLLIMVEPYFIPEKDEMEAYLAFMEAGNTILLFKSNPKGMFGLDTAYVQQDTDSDKKYIRLTDQESNTFRAELFSPVRLVAESNDDILLKDKNGPLAIKRPVGKGSLIVSNSPEWMVNQALLNYDHIPLILSLLNEGQQGSKTIMFDEYSHGGENGSTFMTLYPKWFLVLVLQGILLTILLLWNQGKRFGPILIPREDTVRFSDEGIRALAAWYIRGRRYHDSLLIQADYTKQILQERWGISSSKSWGIPEKELKPFLKSLENILAKEKISKKEYIFWSKNLDRLRKEVEEG